MPAPRRAKLSQERSAGERPSPCTGRTYVRQRLGSGSATSSSRARHPQTHNRPLLPYPVGETSIEPSDVRKSGASIQIQGSPCWLRSHRILRSLQGSSRHTKLILDEPSEAPVKAIGTIQIGLKTSMKDPQLAGALRSLAARIDEGEWLKVGGDPEESMIRESELADQIAYRTQLLRTT